MSRGWLFLSLALLACPTACGKTCNIAEYGAVADGTTLNTDAIAKAVSDCCSSKDASNSILVPAAQGGSFLTASVVLTCSYLTLEVQAGATLKGSEDQSVYKTLPPLPSYGEARDTNCRDRSKRYMPLIFASNVTNINIVGGGTIDGNGREW